MNNAARRDGFTLVEVLVTIFIVTLVIPSFLYFFKTSLDRALHYLDYRYAVTRISMAESLLRMPVYYCGYGMPVSADLFHKSFGNMAVEPYSWNGPVSSSAYNGRENAQLRIVYGTPEDSVTASAFNYEQTYRTIHMSENFSPSHITADYYGYSRNVKSWILFGGTIPEPTPLQIRNISGRNLIVRSYLNDGLLVPKGDKMYLLSAMKVFVKGDILYSYDFKTIGDQPRVRGIADMRFIVDDDRHKITVYLLARGYAKRTPAANIINGAETCPPELLHEWQGLNTGYELYASKIVWRLPNCIGGNFLSGKNAAVQF